LTGRYQTLDTASYKREAQGRRKPETKGVPDGVRDHIPKPARSHIIGTSPFVAVQLQTTYTPLTAATRAPLSLHSDPSPFTPFPAQPDPPYGALRQHTNSTIQLIDWLFSPPEETITAPPFVGGGDAAGYRNFLIRSKIPVPQNSDADWGDLKRHLQPDDLRTE
jgi:hypothetical protein